MKIKILMLTLILIVFGGCIGTWEAQKGTLVFTIEKNDSELKRGVFDLIDEIEVWLYKKGDYSTHHDETNTKNLKVKWSDLIEKEVTIDDIEPGEYAFSIYARDKDKKNLGMVFKDISIKSGENVIDIELGRNTSNFTLFDFPTEKYTGEQFEIKAEVEYVIGEKDNNIGWIIDNENLIKIEKTDGVITAKTDEENTGVANIIFYPLENEISKIYQKIKIYEKAALDTTDKSFSFKNGWKIRDTDYLTFKIKKMKTEYKNPTYKHITDMFEIANSAGSSFSYQGIIEAKGNIGEKWVKYDEITMEWKELSTEFSSDGYIKTKIDIPGIYGIIGEVMTEKIRTPYANVKGQIFPHDTKSVEVELKCDTEGVEIRYTTDGVDPDKTSTVYKSGEKIILTGTTIIKAKAYKEGMIESDVMQETYTFTIAENRPPKSPYAPYPTNGEFIKISDLKGIQEISWGGEDEDGDKLTFEIWLSVDKVDDFKKYGETEQIIHGVYGSGKYSIEVEQGKVYYWKIKAKDGKGGETEGPVWKFIVEKAVVTNNPPKFQYFGTYPEVVDGIVSYDLILSHRMLHFSWDTEDTDGDIPSYKVFMGDAENNLLFYDVKIEIGKNATNGWDYGMFQVDASIIEKGKTYYWQIEVNDGNGNIVKSDILKFIVQ